MQEEDLVGMFYMLEETGEHSHFPEIFYQLDVEFQSKETYAQAVVDQLEFMYQETAKHYKPNELFGLQHWHVIENGTDHSEPLFILQQLQLLKECLKGYKPPKIVVYLSPRQIYDYPGWATWVEEMVTGTIPDGLLIMLKDYQELKHLEKPLSKAGKKTQVIKANLDLFGAMKQEAAAGQMHDPGVQFRVAFIEMAEAAGKKNLPKLKELGGKCIELADKLKRIDLMAASHLAFGTHLLNLEKLNDAMPQFQKALDLTEQEGAATSPVEISAIRTQAYAAIAASHLLKKKNADAGLAYQNMADVAEKAGDQINLLEALRMCGYCLETDRKLPEALEYYKKAFSVGKRLPEDTIGFTTFPYIAESVLNLCKRFEPKSVEKYREETETLIGKEWQNGHREIKA